MYKANQIGSIVCSFLLLFVFLRSDPSQEWEAEYNRLEKSVKEKEDEPGGNPKYVEPYLRSMADKAKDRDEVKNLLEKVNRASFQNPDDENLKKWTKKFFYLLERAQASGLGTVNEACMKFMYVEDSRFPKHHYWQPVLERLQKDGRRIYLKAQETDFVSPTILSRAKCMVNFCIKNVECDSRGWGVYEGRESFFGYVNNEGYLVMWDRDFSITCEPRSDFEVTSTGVPDKPTEMGLEWIERVREEAKWWQFEREYKDATDLMNQFYKDSMCEVPWNLPDQGHRYFGGLANKHNLQESLEYNEDFYGTLYGKVEIVTSGGRMPAAGAVVTVTAPNDGESWTGETDSEGNYEINDVLLHKEYKPLEISAKHGQDEVWDSFYGPLEEPDPGYRHEENLEIRKGDLLCRISVGIDWVEYWDNRQTRHTGIAKATVSGIWRYRPDESVALAHLYEPVSLKGDYSYQELRHDLTPNEGCPTLHWSLQGQGGVQFPQSGAVSSLRVLQMGPMGAMYELQLLGTEAKIIPGKKRKSAYPDDCQTYEKYSRDVVIGHFTLLLPVDKNGEMSGSRSWTSTSGGMPTHIGFGIRQDFSGNLHYSPEQEPHSPERKVNIRAEWKFEKVKKN